MTAKKNYTNGDIIKRLDDMDNRLGAIEVWKIGQEAGRAAVDEYKRQESKDRSVQATTNVVDTVKTLTPYVIALLVAAAAVLYLHAGSRQ
jgi:hypothetical protein